MSVSALLRTRGCVALLALSLIVFPACQSEPKAAAPETVEAPAEPAEPTVDYVAPEEARAPGDVYAMYTTSGAVKMGLTDETLYLSLSDEMLREVDREIKTETEDVGEFGAAIAEAVRSGVNTLLSNQLASGLDEVQDVRYEGGRLLIEWEDQEQRFTDISINGAPLETQFRPEDAQGFVEAFQRLKANR